MGVQIQLSKVRYIAYSLELCCQMRQTLATNSRLRAVVEYRLQHVILQTRIFKPRHGTLYGEMDTSESTEKLATLLQELGM